MKVLHFSTHDIHGGAARAAYRIHQAVAERMGSYMAVNSKLSDDYRVIPPASVSQRFLAKILNQLNYQPARYFNKDSSIMFSNGMFSTPGHMKVLGTLKPDVVNLHWINEGLLSIKKISRFDVPVVWTVHDMWPFTGGCHYTVNCEKYKTKCGQCPQLKSSRSYDLSTYIFNLKKKLSDRVTFVAPSLWMKDCIEQSALFKNTPVHHIPYPINTEVYKPRPKNLLRELLGLPLDKNLILFGAMNALQDDRKGFKYLLSALQFLQINKSIVGDTELVVFGSSKPQEELNKIFKTHYLGKFSDELSIALIYGACDVFVGPSTQDNLPNTVIESLANGVPVVAFNIGGMPDMVTSGYNGYLAEPFSGESLAEAINNVLTGDREALSTNSRQKVLENYAPELIAGQYSSLYNSLV